MNVEKIILYGSNRGMEQLSCYLPLGYCLVTTKKLLSLPKKVIFLFTGFCVNGYAETDGPIGTYFLAKGLAKIGFTPVILSDICCENLFQPENERFQTIFFPVNEKIGRNQIEKIVRQHQPVCYISIERCGKTDDGRYLNMAGDDITKTTAQLDKFFSLKPHEVLTIGIGDGGNEIGMGNLANEIKAKLNITPSIVSTDELIISTVSNWGAYALLACIQKETCIDVLPSFRQVLMYAEFLKSQNCVDGVSGIVSLTVDGLDISLDEAILNALKKQIDK